MELAPLKPDAAEALVAQARIYDEAMQPGTEPAIGAISFLYADGRPPWIQCRPDLLPEHRLRLVEDARRMCTYALTTGDVDRWRAQPPYGWGLASRVVEIPDIPPDEWGSDLD